MKKDSIKNIRINQEVQRELSVLISREIKDPRIPLVTSILHVEVAPDLKTAKIFISVLGDEDTRKNALKGLKSASSFLRVQLAKRLNLRNTPELIFIIDESIEYGATMMKLIDEVTHSTPQKKESEDFDEDLDTEDQDDEFDED